MIKVIQFNRRSIGLGLLLLLGLILAGMGFTGVGKGWLSQGSNSDLPASVTVTPVEQARDSATDNMGSGATGVPLSPPLAPDPENSSQGTGFFVEYRMDRERARGMQVEILREVMASPTSDAESRQTAQQEFIRLSNNMTKEMELENLLRARGFQDAAVFLDHENVTVVLQPGSKTIDGGNSEIANLVAKSTGVDEPNVIMIIMAAD